MAQSRGQKTFVEVEVFSSGGTVQEHVTSYRDKYGHTTVTREIVGVAGPRSTPATPAGPQVEIRRDYGVVRPPAIAQPKPAGYVGQVVPPRVSEPLVQWAEPPTPIREMTTEVISAGGTVQEHVTSGRDIEPEKYFERPLREGETEVSRYTDIITYGSAQFIRGVGTAPLAGLSLVSGQFFYKAATDPIGTGTAMLRSARYDPFGTAGTVVGLSGLKATASIASGGYQMPIGIETKTSIKIPTSKTGATTYYRGISIRVGTKGYNVLGYQKGRGFVTGTKALDLPHIRKSMYEKGEFAAVTAGEAAIMIKSLKKHSPKEYFQYKTALDIMRQTKSTESMYRSPFPETTKTLGEFGVKKVLGFAKKHQGSVLRQEKVLYGSFPTQAQIMPRLKRLPADIDIHIKGTELKVAGYAKSLLTDLKKTGGQFKISAKKPMLIEAKIGGKWHHAVDIHAVGGTSASGVVPPKAFGLMVDQPAVRIQGLQVQRLSAQGVAKGRSILSLRKEGIGPASHRVKDIPDFFAVQETLARSKFIGGKAILSSLKTLKSTYPKAIQQMTPSGVSSPVAASSPFSGSLAVGSLGIPSLKTSPLSSSRIVSRSPSPFSSSPISSRASSPFVSKSPYTSYRPKSPSYSPPYSPPSSPPYSPVSSPPYSPTSSPPYSPSYSPPSSPPSTMIFPISIPNPFKPPKGRRKGFNLIGVTSKTKYTPSLTARLLDIRGKKPRYGKMESLMLRPKRF